MSDSTQKIRSAVDGVVAAFPFPGYITPGARQSAMHVASQLLAHVEPHGARLLDIGCGPMDKTAVFRRLGFQCSAIDDLTDPWHLRDDNLARILAFAHSEGIDFRRGLADENNLPAGAGTFDVVTCLGIIEHLHSSPRPLLNLAGLCLKPGGILCIVMPNSVNLRKRLSVLLGRTNYPPVEQFYFNVGAWRGHVREYTPQETVFICRANGFEPVSTTMGDNIAYDRLRGWRLRAYLAVAAMAPGVRTTLCVLARRPEGWTPKTPDDEACRNAMRSSIPDAVA